jgi:DnaJ-class molecular chaperone
MAKQEYSRSQDFRIAQLMSDGEGAEYPSQLDQWEEYENEKPGKRGNCHVCPGNGTYWDAEKQQPCVCPRCNGTGKVKQNV